MIWHHKQIPLVGINDIDALVLTRTSLNTIFRIEVRLSTGRNMDSQNISFHSVIGCPKHILLIRVKDINALVSLEKLLLLTFLELKYIFQLG